MMIETKELYKKEFQKLKEWDRVEDINRDGRGNIWLTTAGHAYLVLPKLKLKQEGLQYPLVSRCSFNGRLAFYLEEDVDAPRYLKKAI